MTSIHLLESSITKKTLYTGGFNYASRFVPDFSKIIGIYYQNLIPAIVTLSTGTYTLTTGDVLSDITMVEFTPVTTTLELLGKNGATTITPFYLSRDIVPTELLTLRREVEEQVIVYRTLVTLLLSIVPTITTTIPSEILEFNEVLGNYVVTPGRNILKELFVPLHSTPSTPISDTRMELLHNVTKTIITTIEDNNKKAIATLIQSMLTRYLSELCILSIIINLDTLTDAR